jgi:hypothetical protein
MGRAVTAPVTTLYSDIRWFFAVKADKSFIATMLGRFTALAYLAKVVIDGRSHNATIHITSDFLSL